MNVFNTLYLSLCYDVSWTTLLVHEDFIEMLLLSSFLKIMKTQIETCFDNLIKIKDVSSREIYHDNLWKLQRYWSKLRYNAICFICLSWTSQFNLSCKHSLCEICVRIFKDCCERDSWVFKIHACFLCEVRLNIKMKVKSDTTSVRIFSIDEENIREVVSLQILKVLKNRVNLLYLIQKNFDDAFNISSNISFSVYISSKNWHILECLSILTLFINE